MHIDKCCSYVIKHHLDYLYLCLVLDCVLVVTSLAYTGNIGNDFATSVCLNLADCFGANSNILQLVNDGFGTATACAVVERHADEE